MRGCLSVMVNVHAALMGTGRIRWNYSRVRMQPEAVYQINQSSFWFNINSLYKCNLSIVCLFKQYPHNYIRTGMAVIQSSLRYYFKIQVLLHKYFEITFFCAMYYFSVGYSAHM